MSEDVEHTASPEQVDEGAREPEPIPCCKRINHRNELEGAALAVTWCTQPDGHAGQCSGPVPRVLDTNAFTPTRSK